MEKSRSSVVFMAVFSLITASVGCGGGSAEMIKVTTFTEEDAKYFDNSADFVADPNALEGRWNEDWQRDLEGRVEHSDYIGTVKIVTLVTNVTPEKKTSYCLTAAVDKTLKGKSSSDGFSLSVGEEEDGYPTIDANRQRILNRSFLAFIKWRKTESGTIEARWHLSPASDEVVGSAVSYFKRGEQSQHYTKVVVHQN